MNVSISSSESRFYEALRSRDRRFDGMFYVGVKTTGIYCRPVCPSRTPLKRNCEFFPIAAAAQLAGYRPCLRCRPELAPAEHRSEAETVAAKLVRLLREAALDGRRLEDVATLSGWSVRQLRRKITEECGVSPSAIMHTERLLFAKRLLHETDLPIGEVALSAGYRSVRRFNAVFAERCGMKPSAIRSSRGGATEDESIRLRLDYRGPYAWEQVLAWLRLRATRGVELVDERAWMRTISLSGRAGWMRVSQSATGDSLLVEIAPELAAVLPQIVRRLRGLFDLDANPVEIASVFERDPRLGAVARDFPGLRVPGAWDVFETAVRTVVGQQVTVAAASTVASRLAERFGALAGSNPFQLSRIAVTPAAIAEADSGEIAQLGMPEKRAMALQAVARHALEGGFEFSPFATITEVSESLQALPGIGAWTADYIAMRALRYPDAFPAGDIALRKALGGGNPVSIAAAEQASLAWRPWRAYAAALLWQSTYPTPND